VLEVTSSRESGFSPVGKVSVVFRRDRAECDDRLRIRGHRRELKKLLQHAEVPPWQRECYPLLVDRAGIVAVPGVGYRDADPKLKSQAWHANWRPDVH
jgi:tRNA(Ile)-lysidine synthetase-like protein